MKGMEGLSQIPQEKKPEPIPAEAMERMKNFRQASQIWKELELGATPLLPEDITNIEGIIDVLQFLKEKNAKPYTKEEEELQFKKVDAYIERLRQHSNGGLQKAA